MDPASAAFTPASVARDDIWRFQADMMRVQQTQREHDERLGRLERRQDDDARLKSVWGQGVSSAFPGVLSGTPVQAPLHHPPLNPDSFASFDDPDHPSLMGSLHLDATEAFGEEAGYNRKGATSRANSVRFDESANQSHWSHRSSSIGGGIDLLPTSRSASALGSHPMIERTYSHKSDGRQSSAGHSVHSATSGRANSLGIETPFSGLGTSPMGETVPAFVPGLLILGSVPSIIRCWLNENFKHDALLYAAVCSGSHGSFLDERLIMQLGFAAQVKSEATGDRKLKLRVYFPEATTSRTTSTSSLSRPSSPTPQLPCITIDFTVISGAIVDEKDRAIQIFIGSDVLRAHSADVLFSTNQVTLFDDERRKLSIPMVRPENDQVFKSLRITSSPVPVQQIQTTKPTLPLPIRPPSPLDGLKQSTTNDSVLSSPRIQPSTARTSIEEKSTRSTTTSDEIFAGSGRTSLEPKSIPLESTAASSAQALPPRSTSLSGSSNIWGSWRRTAQATPISATPTSATADDSTRPSLTNSSTPSWASATSTNPANTSYQRREHGIKVLKPKASTARTASSNNAGVTSPANTSRFFPSATAGEEKESSLEKPQQSKVVGKTGGNVKTNPIGGATAFAWMAK